MKQLFHFKVSPDGKISDEKRLLRWLEFTLEGENHGLAFEYMVDCYNKYSVASDKSKVEASCDTVVCIVRKLKGETA